MSEILIDLNVLELGEGRNPFDELASKIEQLSLKGSESGDVERLEQMLLFIERKYQDLQDKDVDKAKVLMQAVNANLLMVEAHELNSLDIISKNLQCIKKVSVDLISSKIQNVDSYILGNVFKSHDNFISKISITDLSKAFNSVFLSDYTQNVETKTEWIIELNFKTGNKGNHKPLEFIHTFIEGLNTIPGVSVTLEDIKIGSIQAKVKAVFDSVTSKEEVKEVLETARKFAVGKLEKEFSEVEKANSETQKNQIETQLLEENLQNLKSEESKEFKKLETESIRYDIEKKRLENEILKIKLFKERKELLKELLADGFISQKELEILIKGITFLKIENGILTVGENIDVIDNL